MTRGAPMTVLAALLAASTACAGPMTSGPRPPSRDAGRTASTTTIRVDPAQAARLQRVMVRRAGHPKEMMIDALTWLMQVSGPDSGGFFATHPGTADRIEALRKTP